MKIQHWFLFGAVACSSGTDDPNNPQPPEPPVTPPITNVSLAVEVVASGLSNPVHLTAPANDSRLFVVEQPGRIRIISGGTVVPTPFLDITSKVRSGGEQGLLSMAFDPRYATNGFFYVNYTDLQGHTRVERYRVSSNANVADPASARQILFVEQPYSNHNGGHIVFGPDGMLYIAMGDGGAGGDPQNRAQDRTNLLGDLLRIDVSQGDPYAIPSSNPFFAQSSARNEIWAYGLRNPWRIAFDRVDNLLYVADVGQNAIEEINVVPATAGGINYGWRIMEGRNCFNPSSNCNQTGLTLPAVTYTHAEGCSVTGGLVYRGSRIPAIRGHYFYSDWCQGWIKSFRYANGGATDQRTWNVGSIGNVLSFGEDATGEMYVLSQNGRVYRFISS